MSRRGGRERLCLGKFAAQRLSRVLGKLIGFGIGFGVPPQYTNPMPNPMYFSDAEIDAHYDISEKSM